MIFLNNFNIGCKTFIRSITTLLSWIYKAGLWVVGMCKGRGELTDRSKGLITYKSAQTQNIFKTSMHNEVLSLHNDKVIKYNDDLSLHNDKAIMYNVKAIIHNDDSIMYNDKAIMYKEEMKMYKEIVFQLSEFSVEYAYYQYCTSQAEGRLRYRLALGLFILKGEVEKDIG